MKMYVLTEAIRSSSVFPRAPRDELGVMGESICALCDVLEPYGNVEIDLTLFETSVECARVLQEWAEGESVPSHVRAVVLSGAETIRTFDSSKMISPSSG